MSTDELLARLAARYGVAFAEAGRDPQAVRREWGSVLAAMPAAMVDAALRHLPANPVSALGFHALGAMHFQRPNAPGTAPPPLPNGLTHTNTTAVALRERARLDAMREGYTAQGDGKDWARKLQQRERNGERVTPAVSAMWRAVLKWEGPA